jgi:amino acid permease
MNNDTEINQTATDLQEEKEIVHKAKKRVGFKIHSCIFFLACVLLWLFWLFIFRGSSDLNDPAFNICLFVTLVWGICVLAHYLFVYKWNKTYVEKEIALLKKQKEQQEKELQQLKEQQEKENLDKIEQNQKSD